jgi:hypothetical protein
MRCRWYSGTNRRADTWLGVCPERALRQE